jgi:hypothetical protein
MKSRTYGEREVLGKQPSNESQAGDIDCVSHQIRHRERVLKFFRLGQRAEKLVGHFSFSGRKLWSPKRAEKASDNPDETKALREEGSCCTDETHLDKEGRLGWQRYSQQINESFWSPDDPLKLLSSERIR